LGCSVRSLTKSSGQEGPRSLSQLWHVLTLVESMQDGINEELYLSVVEACIHTQRWDVLAKQTDNLVEQAASPLGTSTYGIMIDAFGHAGDIKRCWQTWDHMVQTQQVQPTPATLGCMVAAFLGNGRHLEARSFVKKMWGDDSTSSLPNAEICSRIFSALARVTDTRRTLMFYVEMKTHGVEANATIFDIVLNASLLAGAIDGVLGLLEDMKLAQPAVEPDIPMYSKIVRALSDAGNMEDAFRVLNDMKASGVHSPCVGRTRHVVVSQLLRLLRSKSEGGCKGDAQKAALYPRQSMASSFGSEDVPTNLLELGPLWPTSRAGSTRGVGTHLPPSRSVVASASWQPSLRHSSQTEAAKTA